MSQRFKKNRSRSGPAKPPKAKSGPLASPRAIPSGIGFIQHGSPAGPAPSLTSLAQPDFPPLANPDQMPTLHEAECLESEGRLFEARRVLVELARHQPDNPDLLARLAKVTLANSNAIESLQWCDRRVALTPDCAEAHGRRGVALQALARHQQAVDAFGKALSIDPAHVPSWCGLAQVYERTHRIDEAREALSHAQKVRPDDPWLKLHHARLIARLIARTDDLPQAVAVLDDLAATPELPADLRHECLCEQARLADRQKDYAAAMRLMAEAQHAALAGEQNEYAQLLERIEHADALVEKLTPSLLLGWARQLPPPQMPGAARTPSAAASAPPPIAFLVGFPRSGTTMTEQLLAASGATLTTDEAPVLDRLRMLVLAQTHPQVGSITAEDELAVLCSLQPQDIAALQAAYVRAVEEQMHQPLGGRMLVDKNPLNIAMAPWIARIFPHARILVALRDPRDVCLSCLLMLNALGSVAAPFRTPERVAHYYARTMARWRRFRAIAANPWIQFRYEDLTAEPEAVSRELFESLGLPWSERVLQFHTGSAKRYVRTPSYQAVSQPIHRKAVGKWVNYSPIIAPLGPILREAMVDFGYESET